MRRSLIDGRYVPGDLLGGGGMAQVYLARDEVLGRDVALKILRERYAHDEGFVERFRREAKNAAALNHPSIVQVYDQGSTEDGDHYIAMECVPGGTLSQRIKREGPLDPREAAGVASRVAEALSVAHGRGIIHRDIKPQNVLLTASGEAKVADFGIARAASSKTMTETSLILGTASYMSPEQVRGERAGPESDLYSLGVVLYEMLTGEQPYTADNPIATAMKHLDEPPRHPREANPAVPEDLDALTAKLLAKQPEDRYASAAELAEDLRRVREGLQPLVAEPGQQTTAQMPRDTGETRTAPTVVAQGGGPGPAAGSRSRRALLPLLALLLGAVLLGGLAWALARGTSDQGTERVEVPRVVGLSLEEARGRLGDAGLELGSRNEAASNEFAAGAVVEQNPPAGNQAERGTSVDVVVSTGPALEPTTQSPSTATSSASSTATSSATAPASTPPVEDEDAQEAAEEAEKAAEEEAKEQEKAQKEAEKRAKEKPPPGGGGKKGKGKGK